MRSDYSGIGYRVSAPAKYDHRPYLTNVNAIEAFTGLDFFTVLSEAQQEQIEKATATATELWPD